MKSNCIVCDSFIAIQPSRNYCTKCGSIYDNQMRFIPSRHNWNLKDYAESFLKDSELSRSKHQN